MHPPPSRNYSVHSLRRRQQTTTKQPPWRSKSDEQPLKQHTQVSRRQQFDSLSIGSSVLVTTWCRRRVIKLLLLLPTVLFITASIAPAACSERVHLSVVGTVCRSFPLLPSSSRIQPELKIDHDGVRSTPDVNNGFSRGQLVSRAQYKDAGKGCCCGDTST